MNFVFDTQLIEPSLKCAEENMFFAGLREHLQLGITEHIQLGITDQDSEGTWKTFYGEPIHFENWGAGYGVGSGGSDVLDFAVLFTQPGRADLAVGGSSVGAWYDVGGINFWYPMLCTYEPSVDLNWSLEESKYCCTFETFLDLPDEQDQG